MSLSKSYDEMYILATQLHNSSKPIISNYCSLYNPIEIHLSYREDYIQLDINDTYIRIPYNLNEISIYGNTNSDEIIRQSVRAMKLNKEGVYGNDKDFEDYYNYLIDNSLNFKYILKNNLLPFVYFNDKNKLEKIRNLKLKFIQKHA